MEYNITGICMIGHFYLVNTQIEANIYNKKKSGLQLNIIFCLAYYTCFSIFNFRCLQFNLYQQTVPSNSKLQAVHK